jgi:hypothetical protein
MFRRFTAYFFGSKFPKITYLAEPQQRAHSQQPVGGQHRFSGLWRIPLIGSLGLASDSEIDRKVFIESLAAGLGRRGDSGMDAGGNVQGQREKPCLLSLAERSIP